MKIIVANKYHYVDGGPERYMFNLSDYLKSLGHEVIPFSVAYPKNIPSEYDRYFLKPAGGGTNTKLDRLEGGIGTKLRIAARSVYSFEAKKALERLIVDTRPDLMYCLNIVNHLSPSIIDAGRRHGLPVVMRLSDYYLVCPNYLFLHDGQVCTECEHGYYHALKHRCVYGSLAATACRVTGMYIHKLMGIYRKVGAFVTTTDFMRDTLIRAGFPPEKIHVIRTFVDTSKWIPHYDNDGYILYLGRLAREKGIEFLLDAYVDACVKDPLVIVGEGPEEYLKQLIVRIPDAWRDKVKFLGYKSGDELKSIISGAKYVAVPSLWHDNAPNVVYESFAAGKPVVASSLGGLREQVTKDTGILVEPGNIPELSKAIIRLSGDADLVQSLGREARRQVENEHRIEDHAACLLGLFSELIGGK